MESVLQYRRIGLRLESQIGAKTHERRDPETNAVQRYLSRQPTRYFNGKPVLVVGWDDPEDSDPSNPRNWPTARRLWYLFIVTLIGMTVGASAPIDAPVLPQASQDLGVSQVTESLAVGIFLIGFGFGALFCGPFSEVLGRSWTYISTLALFCVWLMASALAPNIGAQLVFRFLAGFAGASPLVCAGGSISDMFTPLEKTWIFPIFAVGGFGGPVLGPVMSAYIGTSPLLHTWRWSEWVALIMSGLVFTIVFLFLPETYAPLILTWKAKHLRRITGDDRYFALHEIDHIKLSRRLLTALKRPFMMAATEPVIALITLYLSVIYIILFTFFDGYQYIFQKTYGLSQGLTFILFIPMLVGILAGFLPLPFVWRYTQRQFDQLGTIEPEARLLFAMAGGAPAIPISLFWMAWTCYPSISIWCPLLSSVLFGYGVITVFISAYMYLIDTYEVYAASALTFATLVRYCCAGGMTVVGIPFYRHMGPHWTLTILACLSVPLTVLPYAFYRFGARLRMNSGFAPRQPAKGADADRKAENEGSDGQSPTTDAAKSSESSYSST